jgi:hypothetical protein
VWPELIASGWGSVGFAAEAGARYGVVSLDAEVHGDPSTGSQSIENGQANIVGTVSFARLSGALSLCGHVGWFAGVALPT